VVRYGPTRVPGSTAPALQTSSHRRLSNAVDCGAVVGPGAAQPRILARATCEFHLSGDEIRVLRDEGDECCSLRVLHKLSNTPSADRSPDGQSPAINSSASINSS
jgi:hypothetical protein